MLLLVGNLTCVERKHGGSSEEDEDSMDEDSPLQNKSESS